MEGAESRGIMPRSGLEPISEGVVTGALQVPPSGQPIALGPDRQTVGGYGKLAIVIAADLRHLGQAREGDLLQFSLVESMSAIDAQRDARLTLERCLAAMEIAHDWLPAESPGLLRLLC